MNKFFSHTILALAALLCLASCRTAQEVPSAPEAKGNTKIVSFNIRNAGAWTLEHDGENAWPNRKGAVPTMINQERPDAIGLQEMLGDQIPFLDSTMNEAGYGRVGVGRDDGKKDGEMMAVYYRRDRWELLRSATYWLSATPEAPSRGWDGACNRTVTVVLLKDRQSGRKLLYMNTHLDHVGKEARKEGVALLTDIANEWSELANAVVIGGDFNSATGEAIYRPLKSNHLLSARDIAYVSDSSMTYTGFGKEKATQIDHFFVRGIRPLRFSVLNGSYGVPYVSDHYPISVEFDL